jgi:hypothetical protein
MTNFTDKIDINKIKKDTDEYILNISKEFLDCMNWDDTKLNDKMTVKEAMKMFGFMMANLMLTINTDFETSRACLESLTQRTKDLNYEDVKILCFMAAMLKFGSNWRKIYKEYSKEFDELNKNGKIGEDASVEVETEEEKK